MANTARDEAEKARGGCYGPRPALAAAPTPADLPMPGVTWNPSQKLAAPTSEGGWPFHTNEELETLRIADHEKINRMRGGLHLNSTPAPTPAEPLNTILQAIVQHCSDANMTFDDLRVLNQLIEKVEQAAAPTPAEPLDVDRMREAHRIAYRDGTDIAVEYNRLGER